MYTPFASVCDDFYVNMRLATQLSLPHNRETVLHFFERVQRQFPRCRAFANTITATSPSKKPRQRRLSLVTLESRRLCAGHVNPDNLEDALKLTACSLQQVPYDLGFSAVEVDYLDILFGFDLSFRGNHDEIIAESPSSGFPPRLPPREPEAKAVDIPAQHYRRPLRRLPPPGRIDVITRTNSYQVRTGDYSNDVISVYLDPPPLLGRPPQRPHGKV